MVFCVPVAEVDEDAFIEVCDVEVVLITTGTIISVDVPVRSIAFC
jgi:hypothetical protein